MHINDFNEWANQHQFICPTTEDEVTEELKPTGNTVQLYISPQGNIVTIIVDKTGEILAAGSVDLAATL